MYEKFAFSLFTSKYQITEQHGNMPQISNFKGND